ncbi:bifunctional acetate--CoA ligase family protein/GNAT family N-acetyltransferase [Phototrophicus methaneseepsis]|uniref:Bifunctional acetate--CoA ligase family protein/GNAT family N-acetyltransferase n=1 Tax=Phototrophicus methaneseepsis TaxID=2710758 RepID=A0A7S8EDN7_9CHLR|nr:bifunctional acetate--CoA ligase family protein/GNAT family N-acetyltransferase [Phototrophicus methaneseepsis]QPC85055.1 bifunctional acetate--CoA ligase family protein/GNAT family N-acetyltransferase [Phototrophicus methaneseepsis]
MTVTSTRRRTPSLDKIFKPNNVAVIGATEKEGSVGRTIIKNLITNPFGGTIFPVNPKRPNVLGIQAYPSILDIPVPIDLAVIVTPARTVPNVVRECVEKGVEGCIIISAGFKEIGEEGAALEREILEIAQGKMRIIGPNCLGVMLPFYGMNATFAGGMARPGNVAFLSQSGAICTAVLDWSFDENVGFSSFISIGSMLDVSWGDLIYYLGDDPQTQSIVIYMESVGEARSFLSAAREVALKKPIIIIKAGRTEAAAAAAASHTGSLTGSDEVLDAAFRRSGILRVNSMSDVFYMAEVLAKQPRPENNRLTIVTNAGGPGVLATDALISGGGALTGISEGTMNELNEFLPDAWSHGNPIDILGDATPERYAQALEIAARDPNSDGLLVILTPQDMTDPTQTAEALRSYAHIEGKPVLASWMGGASIEAGERILNRANIPTFAYPDTAMRLFNYMWKYSYNLRALYETPMPLDVSDESIDRELVKNLIERVRSEGRRILTERESKQLLAAYNVPTTPMEITEDPEAAVKYADEMGYPVVLKLNSETITHKMDVGGVQLNLRNGDEVRGAFDRIKEGVTRAKGAEHFQGVSIQPMIDFQDGYELIIGSSVDPQFGPVLLFGSGGSLVEVFKDRALGLPPLTTTLARRMVEQTKISEALHGVRGRDSVDMDALYNLLVRFSQLVAEQPWIAEMDINPLLASPTNVLALDARVVLHPADTKEEDLPVTAIRPYPVQYMSEWVSEHDGTTFFIRPVRPEDEPAMVRFHETLSERTVQLRYFTPMNLSQRVEHERLSRIVFIDYDREIVLVAMTNSSKNGEPEIGGVARLNRSYDKFSGEFGILISDRYQGLGLGRALLNRVIEIGREENVAYIYGRSLKENEGMINLAEQMGFNMQENAEGVVEMTMEL